MFDNIQKVKFFLLQHALIIVYLSSQSLLFVFAFFPENIIGERIDLTKALILQGISLILVFIGYKFPIIVKERYKSIIRSDIEVISPSFFYTISVALVVVGVITSILTISSIISPQDYLTSLFNGDQQISAVRQEAGDGGLQGIFKMMNYFPLTIYLFSSSIYFFFNLNSGDKLIFSKLKKISLLASILKIFFSLDRLTIMAILIVQLYQLLLRKRLLLKFSLLISAFYGLSYFISNARMPEYSIFDFLILYCKLSIYNFQKVIDYQDIHTFGLQTFLHPIIFIFKNLWPNMDEVIIKKYVWNYAQYFNSYLYVDFGIVSIIFYPFFGYALHFIEYKRKFGSVFFNSVYFLSIFTIATFITVPFIRAVEWWLMIITIFLLSKCLRYQLESKRNP